MAIYLIALRPRVRVVTYDLGPRAWLLLGLTTPLTATRVDKHNHGKHQLGLSLRVKALNERPSYHEERQTFHGLTTCGPCLLYNLAALLVELRAHLRAPKPKIRLLEHRLSDLRAISAATRHYQWRHGYAAVQITTSIGTGVQSYNGNCSTSCACQLSNLCGLGVTLLPHLYTSRVRSGI